MIILLCHFAANDDVISVIIISFSASYYLLHLIN